MAQSAFQYEKINLKEEFIWAVSGALFMAACPRCCVSVAQSTTQLFTSRQQGIKRERQEEIRYKI